MPTYVEAKVDMIAWTECDSGGLQYIQQDLGADPEWESEHHGRGDAQELIEFSGRMCYRSYGVGPNANVTRVREDRYIEDSIVGNGHGSVLEHGSVTFALSNVSRVLTHELVRHRAGAAYSQESMRFVRLDDIKFVYPAAFEPKALVEHLKKVDWVAAAKAEGMGPVTEEELSEENIGRAATEVANDLWHLIDEHLSNAEQLYKIMCHRLSLDHVPMSQKKIMTSAMRRVIPDGIATNIVVTANHRAWRHMIAMRTSPGAEEEIRRVFLTIYHLLNDRFPSIYGDGVEHKDNGSIVFKNEKV